MKLIEENGMYRFYYGHNDKIKGGLIDSVNCINSTDTNKVMDNAIIRNEAWISGNAIIKDNAIMENKAHLGHNCILAGNARLSGKVLVGKDFSWNAPVLYIDKIDLEISRDLAITLHRTGYCICKSGKFKNGYVSTLIMNNTEYYESTMVNDDIYILSKYINNILHIRICRYLTEKELEKYNAQKWKIYYGDAKRCQEKLSSRISAATKLDENIGNIPKN